MSVCALEFKYEYRYMYICVYMPIKINKNDHILDSIKRKILMDNRKKISH